MIIRADRPVTPAALKNMQALESETHNMRSDVQVSKALIIPGDAAAGTYSKIEIKIFSKLIPNYISVKTFKF